MVVVIRNLGSPVSVILGIIANYIDISLVLGCSRSSRESGDNRFDPLSKVLDRGLLDFYKQ